MPLIGRFDLLPLAGNHFYDYGEQGVADNLDWCRDNGIACCGGGRNLPEARKPALLVKDEVKIGVLGSNCLSSSR